MIKRLQRSCSFLLVVLILTGCGFHLRGQLALPPGIEPLYIGGPIPNSQLTIEVRNLLTTAGVTLVEDAAAAQSQLLLLSQSKDRRVASLGDGARAAEYQLIESASFELRNNRGETVVGPREITERRIMKNDPNKVVSTDEEEKLQRREMLVNLAAKITRQLRSLKPQAAQ